MVIVALYFAQIICYLAQIILVSMIVFFLLSLPGLVVLTLVAQEKFF